MNTSQGQYWRDVDPNSTMTKFEHTYWITKQSVLKKIGKKEDDCVVASDAELDAKLELFRSIQESCLDLQKIVDRYQDSLCCVALEENAMGRFLKDSGGADGSPAGKMMTNVGKAMSYSGKQRLALRPPLLRLGQEVETFRLRAIADTLSNLKTMEKHRLEYRAALRWMKDVSQELDPERQLDKFRKVQSQVRRSKARFDQLKLDCLQKVDLLAAARCNMFSHALVFYHKTLLEFCEKAANAFQAVANTCKGYQHYEFSVVKELTEPSLRLAEQLNANDSEKDKDNDVLLFFDGEYRDHEEKTANPVPEDSSSSTDPLPTEQLLDLGSLDLAEKQTSAESPFLSGLDLTNDLDLSSSMQVLSGLFQETDSVDAASKEWNEYFGGVESPVKSPSAPAATSVDLSGSGSCLPSSLLEQTPLWTQLLSDEPLKPESKHNISAVPTKKIENKKEDQNPWLNLFADLDPLADPDAVGAKSLVDRNC